MSTQLNEQSQKQSIVESKKLFRRRPLLVEAEAQSDGSWIVYEAGRESRVSKDDFAVFYELVEIDGKSSSLVDVGLADLEPGTEIEKEGRRLVRVSVVAGKGSSAYWYQNKPQGSDCGFRVIADMIDDPNAAHYAGKFVEPWEGSGSVGLKRTWVVVPVKKG